MGTIPLCRYILQGGNPCTQAAITGENYCRHHLVVRRTVAAATPKPDPYRVEKRLPLVFPEDRAALQINLYLVMQAFNEGTIGPKSANIFGRLLHECAVNLKQGPLYETDCERGVRNVVVTPEGEEITPARDYAASGETVSEEPVSEEAVSEDCASGDTRSAQNDMSPTQATTACVGHPRPDSHTSNGGLCGPPTELETQNDFACNDPCYIENLTQRREQYRAVALAELAAGRDPRAWEDFVPGKSKMPPRTANAG